MKVFVTILNDRHANPEPFVFSQKESAIKFAREQARDSARSPGDFWEATEHHEWFKRSGWVYYAAWSEEDNIWVTEKEVE